MIEGKVLHVMEVYNKLMPCSAQDVKEVFGMARNTLTNNLKLSHHPKLKVLLSIFFGWFPEMEGHVFPDTPREIAKHLSPIELQVRIFAAFLDDDADRMREVGNSLILLADKKIPSLSELEMLLKKKESDKKKH